jgi:thymidylate synthase ThyX
MEVGKNVVLLLKEQYLIELINKKDRKTSYLTCETDKDIFICLFASLEDVNNKVKELRKRYKDKYEIYIKETKSETRPDDIRYCLYHDGQYCPLNYCLPLNNNK